MDGFELLLDFCHWLLFKFIWSFGIRPFNPSVFWTFVGGVGTICVILYTYRRYQKNQEEKEKAQINAIIDEICANFGLSRFMPKIRTEKEIKLIISELNNLSKTDKYPNPDEKKDKPLEHRLFSAYDNYDTRSFFNVTPERGNFFLLKNMAISQAMASGTGIILLPRIFLNLKHLDYSIRRLNIKTDQWNSLNKKLMDNKTIKDFLKEYKREYFIWVHFRLLFTLIDILRTYDSKKIYDQDILNRYRKLAGSSWISK